MNEKLLPTTAGTLEEKAIKNALNSVYGTYGTYSAADVRPTCMNDQVWMDICKPYLIPFDRKLLTRNDAIAAISVKYVNTYNSSYYDLCPECVKEFHEWFRKYGKEFNSL